MVWDSVTRDDIVDGIPNKIYAIIPVVRDSITRDGIVVAGRIEVYAMTIFWDSVTTNEITAS